MNEKTILKGTIIKGVGGQYTVLCDAREKNDHAGEVITCRARGVFRHESITPLAGDRVTLLRGGEDTDYVVDEIDERKNSLVRPAMANLTHIFIVIPATRPKPDLLTADKLISCADGKDIESVVVVTKCDIEPDESARLAEIYRTAGFTTFCLSAVTGEGVDVFADFLRKNSRGMCAAFAGASGAGKSTLMGRIFPDLHLATGEVSRKTERGRHTTRTAQLYPFDLGGGICLIADTPGFSMLDYTRFYFFDAGELPYTFREFREYIGECRYTKCTHTKEEGCAILAAKKEGKIPPTRHANYITVLDEIKKKPEWKRKQETRV